MPPPVNAPATIAWEDPHGCLWQGDVRAMLAELPAESVQCVITSPPYWGLRAYGCEPQVWGGDPDCDHGAAIADEVGSALDALWAPTPALPPITGGTGPASAKQVSNAGSQFGNRHQIQGVTSIRQGRANVEAQRNDYIGHGATCTRCGAWRGELGSEPLHDCAGWATGAPCGACFICHLVEVFRAVWRVLRADGVCLVNIGDSYAGGGGYSPNAPSNAPEIAKARGAPSAQMNGARIAGRPAPSGLKAKDLVGIPWRFALALQADGWWLRGDYIWSKPNPMPESVTDRCTRSHEYVFHFTKSDRYFWDADAVRESTSMLSDFGRPRPASPMPSAIGDVVNDQRTHARLGNGSVGDPAGRNARSVWTIPTEAFPGAHFATFPRALVRRAIQAGTSERGACTACGAPWARVVERTPMIVQTGPGRLAKQEANGDLCRTAVGGTMTQAPSSKTIGWAPTCTHLDAEVVPSVVLDPFVGSGTTIAVARQLGRIGWGIELQPDYVDIAIRRLQQMVLL